jgi:hypothetical protein
MEKIFKYKNRSINKHDRCKGKNNFLAKLKIFSKKWYDNLNKSLLYINLVF